jgi:arginase
MQKRLTLIGFPYDENSSFMKGTAAAPSLIRQSLRSDSSNRWSETGIDLGEPSLIIDQGDLDLNSPVDSFHAIENAIIKILNEELLPISLGGDHSITYPIIRAFRGKYARLNILQFDAHPDLYDEFQGNRFSHASPFARIMEQGLVQRLVQVGIRTMNDHQLQQAKKFGVEVIQMKDWPDTTTLKFDCSLYISVDLDVLDPAFAPGISHYEPGGLTPRQAIRLIQTVQAPLIAGADIVEFNPARDLNGLTAMTAAKILKELAGKMVISA